MTITIQELENLWNEVVDTRVVDVNDIKQIVFHSVLGCWLLPSRIYCPNMPELTSRVHLFAISGSRSGKGEVMKLGAVVCEKDLGLRAVYSSGSLTPKALIGGLNKVRNKTGAVVRETETFGQLHSTDYLAWGEARSILSNRDDFGSMKDVLLSALDDPGIVTARSFGDTYEVKYGKIGNLFSYETKSTILTGTIQMKQINTELASSGLLQRFFITVDQKTKDDIKSFFRNIYKSRVESQQKLDRMIVEKGGRPSIDDFNNILLKERRKLRDEIKKIDRKKYIHFNTNEYKAFGKEHVEELEKICSDAPFIGAGLDAYTAFGTNSLNQVAKLAAHKCAIENKEYVKYEDLIYGWEITKKSMEASISLLDKGKISSLTEAEGRRNEIIMSILERVNCMSQKQIYNKLKESYYKNLWDFGEPKTKAHLTYMVDIGLIKKLRGKGSTWNYCLTTKFPEDMLEDKKPKNTEEKT